MLRRALVTFGNSDCGRLGHGAPLQSVELPLLLRTLLDVQVADVSAGGAHTAVVTQEGAVLTFGLNDRHQLGHSPGEAEVVAPQEVPLPEPAVAVAAGHFHTLCVTESGALWAWGCNRRGQLGLGDGVPSQPAPRLLAALQGVRIAGAAAGADHSLAVTSDGEVYSWGWGRGGRLGHGGPQAAAQRRWPARDEPKPRRMRPLETLRIRQVAAGHLHSACLADDGRVFVFGGNRFYQLGLPVDADFHSPREVPGLHSVTHVACGGLHTLAARHGGGISAWGANEHGCLGLGREGPQQVRAPAPVPGLEAGQVSAGWKHSAAVTAGGALYTWGWGGSQGTAMSMQGGGSGGGQLGLGDEFDYWQPARVAALQLRDGSAPVPQWGQGGECAWRVLRVSCGLNHTAAVVELSADVIL